MPSTSPPEVKAGTANNNIKLKNNKMEMKRNLLKTMLCLFATLWTGTVLADEEVVSEATTWTFNDYAETETKVSESIIKPQTNKLYNRSASSGRTFSFPALDEEENLTFSDGTTVNVTRVAKTTNDAISGVTANMTAGTAGNTGTPYFAFNTNVAGTCFAYMKQGAANQLRVNFTDGTTLSQVACSTANEIVEVQLTSSKAGTFFIGATNGTAERYIYAIRFVPRTDLIVGETTTWTFNEYETPANLTFNNTSALSVKNKLYNRSVSLSDVKKFTFEDATPQLLSFTDGYTVKVSKTAKSGANSNSYSNNNMATLTADDLSSNCTPFMAFNTSVAGTCYAYVKGEADGNVRVYFSDGTTATNGNPDNVNANNITEIKNVASKGGTFFIGGLSHIIRHIYAIRFVPASEAKDEWVYIGETGYATWGNNSGKDILELPTGLTAYKAEASSDGHSVTLTALDKMRRGQAYVIKGTPETNYPLTYDGTESVGGEYNGGDMQRVSADMENFAPTNGETGDALRNRYILGNDNGVAKFFTPSGNGTLKKGKAYLQTKKTLTSADPGAPGLNLIIANNNATGINEVKGSEFKVQGDSAYYNLNGQRVAQPTKGLYIVNGKKVVIK